MCDLDLKVKVKGKKVGICDGVPSTAALVLNCLFITEILLKLYLNSTNGNICHFLTFYNWNFLSFSVFPGMELVIIFCHLRNGIICYFLTFPNNFRISDIILNFWTLMYLELFVIFLD